MPSQQQVVAVIGELVEYRRLGRVQYPEPQVGGRQRPLARRGHFCEAGLWFAQPICCGWFWPTAWAGWG